MTADIGHRLGTHRTGRVTGPSADPPATTGRGTPQGGRAGAAAPTSSSWSAPPTGIGAGAAADNGVLGAVQGWLGPRETLARPGWRCVTVRATASGVGGTAWSAGRCGVWCAVAQAEHPGRFLLVDVDDRTGGAGVAARSPVGEPQVALRGGRAASPRWRASRACRPMARRDGVAAGLRGARAAGTSCASSRRRRSAPRWGPARCGWRVRAAGVNFRDVLDRAGDVPGRCGSAGRRGRRRGAGGRAGGDGSEAGRPGDGLFDGAFARWSADRRADVGADAAGWSFAQAARCRWCSSRRTTALVELAGCGRVSGCWCTRRRVAWGWRRCSWPGISGRRCSRRRARPSGTHVRAAGRRRGADRLVADAGVRGGVPGGDRWRGWTWMSC